MAAPIQGDDALQAAALDTLYSNYATVAFVMVLVHDYFLTFSREVDYIWMQSWSKGKVLFLLNRYIPLLDLVILMESYVNSEIHGATFCTVWFHVDSWLMVCSVTVIDVILLLRTWAIWKCSGTIAISLSTLLTVCVAGLGGATLYADFVVTPAPSLHAIRPCATEIKNPDVLYGIWISILVYDTTIMFLTLIKILPEVKSPGKSPQLMTRLLRDGFQYFVALSLISVGNILVINWAPPALSTMLFTFHRIMLSALGSRVILNLRGVITRRQAFDPDDDDVPPELDIEMLSATPTVDVDAGLVRGAPRVHFREGRMEVEDGLELGLGSGTLSAGPSTTTLVAPPAPTRQHKHTLAPAPDTRLVLTPFDSDVQSVSAASNIASRTHRRRHSGSSGEEP